MQDLEYTPSVCFPNNTISKHNLSAELFFELTCTPDKHGALPMDSIMPQLIHPSPVPRQPSSTLKTEDFFEDFENKFVVTFQDDRPANQDLIRTATFQLGVQSNCLQVEERDGTQEKPERGKLSLRGTSLENTVPIEEKGSPISFEVRKRTVFKAKENISTLAQNYKLTKKKIFNQNIFEEFAEKTKVSPFSATHTHHSQRSFPQESQLQLHHPPPSAFSQPYHRSIIERHNREHLRSVSLNIWRKRFNRESQVMEGRPKRDNIFHILTVR